MKETLFILRDEVLNCTDAEKLHLLQSYPKLKSSFYENNSQAFHTLEIGFQIILESLFAIGQGTRIFEGISSFSTHEKQIMTLLETLLPIETFYKKLGGIVGYHVKFLELLNQEVILDTPSKNFERPPGINLNEDTDQVRTAIKKGIDTLSKVVEIYPIAGAADRLNLTDPKTNEPLPAAELIFLGHTLLEGLIRDVIGREYLFYKLKKEQTVIPLVLMTSIEKNNHSHVLNILRSHHWFNRPEKSFFFIDQPLVPVINSDGDWVIKAPLTLALKPGGHGVLWRALQEKQALEWLKASGHTKALIRQINNPIAGVDHGLLALTGIGCPENKIFGFASCERFLGSEEGMDVLVEEESKEGFKYAITNIEYTEFAKRGIQDCPEGQTSPYSCFPANSNILFADLEKIEKTISEHPFPGLTINLKAKNGNGNAGRLESLMQNIADYLTTTSKQKLTSHEKTNLPSFVTYNLRRKTLAATKKAYTPGGALRDTPEGTLIEVMQNNKELLELCGLQVPPMAEMEDYLQNGPSFLFTYHPALGPLYSVITQKLRKGIIHEKGELKLEIAEVSIENLDLKGSLLIQADQITGHLDTNQCRIYSHHTGKCILKNVTISNQGIDPSQPSNYSKYQINRLEAVNIKIEGNGEFFAENVTFKGNYNLTVPSGHRMIARQSDSLEFILEPIEHPSWEWNYHFNERDQIILSSFDFYADNH